MSFPTTSLEIEDARFYDWLIEERKGRIIPTKEINEYIDKILWIQSFSEKIKWIKKWIGYQIKKILFFLKKQTKK